MIIAELNQSRLRGGQRLPLSLLRRALRAVSRHARVRGEKAASIAFVAPGEIRRLNKAYRGKDKATDVLSFGMEGLSESGIPHIGEVLVCYEQAVRQARDIGHSARDEQVFLIVHGLLHLLGYDHERPKDAKRMFPLQERILRSLDIDPRL